MPIKNTIWRDFILEILIVSGSKTTELATKSSSIKDLTQMKMRNYIGIESSPTMNSKWPDFTLKHTTDMLYLRTKSEQLIYIFIIYNILYT